MKVNNDNIKKVGIFDSGVGGYSLLNQLILDFPHIEFYYIADDQGAPYGSKSKDEVKERAILIVDKLLECEVQLIVVACNTATSLAIDDLRALYSLEFVGVEPFVNAIHKFNFDFNKDHIAVLTTSSMFHSERFKALLEKYDSDKHLRPLQVPYLATIIEDIYRDGLDQILRTKLDHELAELRTGGFTHAILGCTHYPLISNYFETVLNIKTISPCPYVSSRVGNYLDAASYLSNIVHYWHFKTSQSKWEKLLKEDLPSAINF